jgi:hypothetical protein
MLFKELHRDGRRWSSSTLRPFLNEVPLLCAFGAPDFDEGGAMTERVGRPHWSPSEADREKVRTMAGLGIQQEKIAAVFGTCEKTLRRHCRVELDTGEAVANTAVGKFLFDAANGKETIVNKDGTRETRYIGVTSATITAAIFWMKTRAHWKETMLHSGNGPEGALPIVLYESDKRL